MSRAVAAFALLLLSASAFAATATAAVTGRVTSSGAPAASVTVSVTGPALQGERTTVTTGSGRYWLTALPPGRYDVTFSRAKLQTLTRRVLVELGRVTRADATLEPSEDEDHITSTAIPLTVTETASATSHFSDETFDRLPMRRDPVNALYLTPTTVAAYGFLNDAPSPTLSALGQESIEELTVLRTALPAEYEGRSAVYLTRSRSGGEDDFFSLRDSITSFDWFDLNFPNSELFDHGVEHLVEANAGGRIIPNELWYFAGAWHGSEVFGGDRKGVEGKLTWQPAPRHDLAAFYTHADVDFGFLSQGASIAALRYTNTAGPLWTTEAVLSRSTNRNALAPTPLPIRKADYDSLFTKTSYVAGDHVLSAGLRAEDTGIDDRAALFVSDRFVVSRVTVNAGLRHEHGRLAPRLAASIDLRGNGRQAITASLSDYLEPHFRIREATAGFATAVGTTGSIRVDGIRRDFGPHDAYAVQADFRYTLFGRFHTGASYTWAELSTFVVQLGDEHVVHAWAGVDVPVGEHELGVTGLQNFHHASPVGVRIYSTDLALRYSLPVSRVRLTVAIDALDVFGDADELFTTGRGFRGWVRLRH